MAILTNLTKLTRLTRPGSMLQVSPRLRASVAFLAGAVPLAAGLGLVAIAGCSNGATPNCAGDAGCGPGIEAGPDGTIATRPDAGGTATDAGGPATDGGAPAKDATAVDATDAAPSGPGDASDASPTTDAPIDSPAQG